MPHFTGSQTRLSREKFYLSDSGGQEGRETFRRLFPFSDLINPQLKSNITCSKTKVTPLPQTVTVWASECKVWQDSKTIWFLSSVHHHCPTPARKRRWHRWEKKRGEGLFGEAPTDPACCTRGPHRVSSPAEVPLERLGPLIIWKQKRPDPSKKQQAAFRGGSRLTVTSLQGRAEWGPPVLCCSGGGQRGATR